MHPRNRQVWATALLIVVLAACSTATSPSTPITPASPPVIGTTAESSVAAQPTVSVESVTTVSLSEFTGWGKSALGLNGSVGEQYTFTCPPGGRSYTVWGTDIYTDDSSVCTAAVHAGLIDFEDGGEVVIEVRPGESYLGTWANGVTTESYGSWGGSFVFVESTVGSAEPSASTLPDLSLPRYPPSVPGEYGWTGALGSRGGMHSVVAEDPSSNEFRQTQLVFAVRNDCFGAGGDPVPLAVAGLDGLFVEPYEDSSVMFLTPRGGETTGGYALPIGDRTLCVYLTWDPTTTEVELAAGRQIVESIRGQPYGEDGIRINFTLPAGWDTG